MVPSQSQADEKSDVFSFGELQGLCAVQPLTRTGLDQAAMFPSFPVLQRCFLLS